MTKLNPNRTVNVAVQVLPLTEDAYPIVDRAIAAIAASGVKYEVTAMETVMEGPLDELLAAARAAQRRESGTVVPTRSAAQLMLRILQRKLCLRQSRAPGLLRGRGAARGDDHQNRR